MKPIESPPEIEASAPEESPSVEESEQASVVSLIAGHKLEIDTKDPSENRLILRAPGGDAHIKVAITAQGISLELSGGDLSLRSEGQLAIDADRVTLRGRRGLVLKSDADARIEAGQTLHLSAEDQSIEATKGDLAIKANDDVRIDGERIKLNS